MPLIDAAYKVINFAERLPLLERVGFYAGASSLILSGVEIEVGNPILGGIHAVVGGATLLGSVSTQAAIEVLDRQQG